MRGAALYRSLPSQPQFCHTSVPVKELPSCSTSRGKTSSATSRGSIYLRRPFVASCPLVAVVLGISSPATSRQRVEFHMLGRLPSWHLPAVSKPASVWMRRSVQSIVTPPMRPSQSQSRGRASLCHHRQTTRASCSLRKRPDAQVHLNSHRLG